MGCPITVLLHLIVVLQAALFPKFLFPGLVVFSLSSHRVKHINRMGLVKIQDKELSTPVRPASEDIAFLFMSSNLQSIVMPQTEQNT